MATILAVVPNVVPSARRRWIGRFLILAAFLRPRKLKCVAFFGFRANSGSYANRASYSVDVEREDVDESNFRGILNENTRIFNQVHNLFSQFGLILSRNFLLSTYFDRLFRVSIEFIEFHTDSMFSMRFFFVLITNCFEFFSKI